MGRLTTVSVLGFLLVYCVPLITAEEKSSDEITFSVKSSTFVGWDPISSAGKIILNRPYPAGVENGNPIFICRGKVDDRFVPGKLVFAGGDYYCSVGAAGKEHKFKKLEILIFSPGATSWVSATDGLPNNAIAGGTLEGGTHAFICRGMSGTDLLIGNYKAEDNVCNVTGGDREFKMEGKFEVLTVNNYGLTL